MSPAPARLVGHWFSFSQGRARARKRLGGLGFKLGDSEALPQNTCGRRTAEAEVSLAFSQRPRVRSLLADTSRRTRGSGGPVPELSDSLAGRPTKRARPAGASLSAILPEPGRGLCSLAEEVPWQREAPSLSRAALRVCALVPGAQLGAPLCSPRAHSFAAEPSPPPLPLPPLPPPPPLSPSPCSSSLPQPAAAMADSASESDTDGAGGNSSSSAAMQSSCSSTSGGGGGSSGGGGGGGSGGGKSGGIVISPFRLEELTNRLASLQQENKVLKIELETYKLKCKALQEENRDLRKASVTIVSGPPGLRRSADLRPPPGEAVPRPRQLPVSPRFPGSRSELTLSRPDSLHRAGEREVPLRGHGATRVCLP